MRLIAECPMTYATRRLKAGDAFNASNRDGKVLIMMKRARDPSARGVGKVDAPPAAVAEKIAEAVAVEQPDAPAVTAVTAEAPAADTAPVEAAPAADEAPAVAAPAPAAEPEHDDANAEIAKRNRGRGPRK